MFEKPEKLPDMIKMLNVFSVRIIILVEFFFNSFMVTHVVSWFGLATDLVLLMLLFYFFHFFVVEDEDEVLHVPDWWLFSCCCGVSLLMRMMMSWCRWFGLVIAFVAVVNSLFLCCQG